MGVFICSIDVDVQVIGVLVENQGVSLQEAFLLNLLVLVKAMVDNERYRFEEYLKDPSETVVVVDLRIEVVEVGINHSLCLFLASHKLLKLVNFGL